MSISVSRKSRLAKKILFVDGLPGCGKTMFASIFSTFKHVEMLSYSYEIEQYCHLYYLKKLPIDTASLLIKLSSDLKLYNSMMGRDVNFRPSDLSSVFQSSDPNKYIRRLFNPGDETVPDAILSEKPILNLSTHNILAFSEPIWGAFNDNCIFIEIVRHPVHMVKQQYLNMTNLIGTERSFTVHFSYKGKEVPYYAYEWRSEYIKMSPMDRVIFFINYITEKIKLVKGKIRQKYKNSILTIPFEPFVLNPEATIKLVSKMLKADLTSETLRVMTEQNVPRLKVGEGKDLGIYKRRGWSAPSKDSNERSEIYKKRNDISKEASDEIMCLLDRLSEEYEEEYWVPG